MFLLPLAQCEVTFALALMSGHCKGLFHFNPSLSWREEQYVPLGGKIGPEGRLKPPIVTITVLVIDGTLYDH